MEMITDWLKLWEELSEIQNTACGYGQKKARGKDAWKNKARKFNDLVKKRGSRPDGTRAFMISSLQKTPGATLVDVGAGTGKWAVALAPCVGRITAVEPSDAMAEVLTENLAAARIENVVIHREEWPHTRIDSHDYVFASHSMYGCGDLKGFVRKMVDVARRRCFMLLRAPLTGSVMAKAAQRVWGQPHDSPNFQIAFNALLQMGLFPNVLMEGDLWDPWSHESLGAALVELKKRLALTGDSPHDDYLKTLLESNLTEENGRYVWPRETRSALIYWDI